MKIAIIGAGPSGLACAREAERPGIIPDVLERNQEAYQYPLPLLWNDTHSFRHAIS